MNHGLKCLKVVGIGFSLVLTAGAIVSAETMPTPETPVADVRLDELDFFAQDWQCESEMPVSGVTSPYQWSVSRDLNDFWFVGQATRPEQDVFERETLGYNTVMKKFGRTIIGNDGKFANFLSDGWTNNTLEWKGRVANMAKKTVDKHWIIVKRTSDSQFRELDYVLSPTDANRWLISAERTCSL